jgi:hypothetical protein
MRIKSNILISSCIALTGSCLLAPVAFVFPEAQLDVFRLRGRRQNGGLRPATTPGLFHHRQTIQHQ